MLKRCWSRRGRLVIVLDLAVPGQVINRIRDPLHHRQEGIGVGDKGLDKSQRDG
jgi:hypothetical protein